MGPSIKAPIMLVGDHDVHHHDCVGVGQRGPQWPRLPSILIHLCMHFWHASSPLTMTRSGSSSRTEYIGGLTPFPVPASDTLPVQGT